MTADLVRRLREGRSPDSGLRWMVTSIHREAADCIDALVKENARLREALETVVKSRDEHCFEREEFVNCQELKPGYWTPLASMVESSAIAAARQALSDTSGPEKPQPTRTAKAIRALKTKEGQ